MNRTRATRAGALGLAALAFAACQDSAERSVALADRLLAVGETERAIAEYKLAQRVSGDTDELLLRLGHAYARQGDVDEALAYYEPLAERDPDARHQVAADLVVLAEGARERGASENMVRSLEPLLEWSLGYVPAELRLALAEHYADDGDYTRALSLYLAVLADQAAPEPAVLYQTGRAYKELGGCDRALPYLERYVEEAGRRHPDRAEARWHYGDCLYAAADEDRAAGRPSAALDKLDRMVELGVPRTHLGEAHFLRGEMLLSRGDTDEALEAYRAFLDLNPNRTGALVRTAEERIRQIRFGFE